MRRCFKIFIIVICFLFVISFILTMYLIFRLKVDTENDDDDNDSTSPPTDSYVLPGYAIDLINKNGGFDNPLSGPHARFVVIY